MRIGTAINYEDEFHHAVDELVDYEAAVWTSCSFGGVQLRRRQPTRVHRGPHQAIGDSLRRPPALHPHPCSTRHDCGRLDHVSEGRFTLGIGASGPQVIEDSTVFRSMHRSDVHEKSSRFAA